MAWRMSLGLQGGKRHSMVDSDQQASLREALRNRGGAQDLGGYSDIEKVSGRRASHLRRSSGSEGSITAALQARGGVRLTLQPPPPKFEKVAETSQFAWFPNLFSGLREPATSANELLVTPPPSPHKLPTTQVAQEATPVAEASEEVTIPESPAVMLVLDEETQKSEPALAAEDNVKAMTDEDKKANEIAAVKEVEVKAAATWQQWPKMKDEEANTTAAVVGKITVTGLRVAAAKNLIETPKITHANVFEKHQKPVPNKLKDLRDLWGKNSVGFAGPNLGGNSRLSKGEAQATLQRLIASSGAIDFNEVRRLRKLIAELD